MRDPVVGAKTEAEACANVAASTLCELNAVSSRGKNRHPTRMLIGWKDDDDFQTQIAMAVLLHWYTCLGMLIARGVDVNASNGRGMTPLLCAAMASDATAVHILLARGRATIQLPLCFFATVPCHYGMIRGFHNMTALGALCEIIGHQLNFTGHYSEGWLDELRRTRRTFYTMTDFLPKQELECLALCYARWSFRPESAPHTLPLVVMRRLLLQLQSSVPKTQWSIPL